MLLLSGIKSILSGDETMISIFISYSSKDLDIATKLHTDLESHGIEVWRDRNGIRKGDFWDDKITEALLNPLIKYVIILISENSIKSEMVKNEIEFASQIKKILVPVIIGDFSHRLLRLIRRDEIDLRNRYDLGLQELLDTLHKQDNIEYQPVASHVEKTSDFQLTDEQLAVARDNNRLIRLIAAPGTGKSLVIEERVRWLLESGVEPEEIAVVSFTRASSRDLKKRIIQYCIHQGVMNGNEVSVTTLHSLALKVLRKANKLYYPVSPQVLDEWEIDNIFDEEFSETKRNSNDERLQSLTPSRAGEVRKAVEAYWNTGKWDHPSYIRPDEPVSPEEIDAFFQFHQPTTQTYSCVLPGEIIKMCVDGIESGTLNPSTILPLRHFIIDEYQDLNYVDQQFIESFITSGCNVFVAGDDDQSIYSFRYAYPTGIQEFAKKYPAVSDYILSECFRCTPAVLGVGLNLIKHESPNGIPKRVISFCEKGSHNVRGILHYWKFRSEQMEFDAIAKSCRILIQQGVAPRNILILISDRKALLIGTPSLLQQKFNEVQLEAEMPTGKHFKDDNTGRFVMALVRIACDTELEDYVAHRTLLGLLKGVGITTCNKIRNKVLENQLNYMDLFYNPLPQGIFTTVEKSALNKARDICAVIAKLHPHDSIDNIIHIVIELLNEYINQPDIAQWNDKFTIPLPNEMTLNELKLFISTDNSEQQESILRDVYTRLGREIPKDGILPQQVRIMTMHGAKGLSADIVIIPGLEEDIIPSVRRRKYPGLIQEGARQLYVSITRARHSVILSYAESRTQHGKRFYRRSASRYCNHLLGKFQDRDKGLSEAESQAIIQTGELYSKNLTH